VTTPNFICRVGEQLARHFEELFLRFFRVSGFDFQLEYPPGADARHLFVSQIGQRFGDGGSLWVQNPRFLFDVNPAFQHVCLTHAVKIRKVRNFANPKNRVERADPPGAKKFFA
jgi:hypothetical protein